MAKRNVRADQIRLDKHGRMKKIEKPKQINNAQDLTKLNESLDAFIFDINAGEQKYRYRKQKYERILKDVDEQFKELDKKSEKAFSGISLSNNEQNEIYELHDNINIFDSKIKREVKRMESIQKQLKEKIDNNKIDENKYKKIMSEINEIEKKISKNKTSRNKAEKRIFEIYGFEESSKIERKQFIDLYCKKEKYEIAQLKNEKSKFRRTLIPRIIRGIAFVSGGWILVLANKAIVKPTKKLFHNINKKVRKTVGKYSGYYTVRRKLTGAKNKVKNKVSAKTVNKLRKVAFNAQEKAKSMEANAGGIGGNIIAKLAKLLAKLVTNIINILVILFWIIVIIAVIIIPVVVIGVILSMPKGGSVDDKTNYKVVITEIRDDFQNYADNNYKDMNIIWKLEDMIAVSFSYKDEIEKASDKEKEILFEKFIGQKHEDKEFKYRQYSEWEEFDKKPDSEEWDEIEDISTTETVTSKKPNKELCYATDNTAPIITNVNISNKKLNITASDNSSLKSIKVIYNSYGFDKPTNFNINGTSDSISYTIPSLLFGGNFKLQIVDASGNYTYYSLVTNNLFNQNLTAKLKSIKTGKNGTGLDDCLKSPPLGDVTEEVKIEKWKARKIKEEYWSTQVQQETESLKIVDERTYVWYECKDGDKVMKEFYDINPYQKEKDNTITSEDKTIVENIFKEWKNPKKIGKAEYQLYFNNNWRILLERYNSYKNMINGLMGMSNGDSTDSESGGKVSLPKGKLIIVPIQGMTRGNISSGFGWRPNLAGNTNVSNHTGTDFAPPGGTNVHILAGQEGEVIGVRDGCSVTSYGDTLVECDLPAQGNSMSTDGGNNVLIQHFEEREDGSMGYYYSWYLHMNQDSVKVKVGDKVKAGQHIGNMGASGMVTGIHLHLELFVRVNENSPVGWGNRQVFDPAQYINF